MKKIIVILAAIGAFIFVSITALSRGHHSPATEQYSMMHAIVDIFLALDPSERIFFAVLIFVLIFWCIAPIIRLYIKTKKNGNGHKVAAEIAKQSDFDRLEKRIADFENRITKTINGLIAREAANSAKLEMLCQKKE